MAAKPGIYLCVDRTRGAFQVSINVRDADGGGHGYRICGPKYDGTATPVVEHRLSERDVVEIERYLAAVGKES